MNEEAEVKAPVTRLRRRLSVEQSEDVKSSPAVGTPTKKRGGRKTAKPELDLIDENAVENNLKTTTKKTIAKDVAELESEKPVTPARRSARIKSNTSIVSDTVQNVDSPRAKRAARRTSQVGSDTEMPLTPARTRRTRKDSSSSIEKLAIATPTVTISQIPEIITEEPDNPTKSTDGSKTSDNETPIRKSPRLVKKKSRASNSSTQDEGNNNSAESNTELITTEESDKNNAFEPDNESESQTDNNIIKEIDNTNSDKNRLSVSSFDLIRNLDDKPKKNSSNSNKSLSEAQDNNKIKSKRQRIKSWTTITDVSSNIQDIYSDNEIIKKRHPQKLGDNIKKKSFNSGSGDNMHNHDSNDDELNCSQNKISSPGKLKKIESISESVKGSDITNLFQKDPSETIRSIIVMEDSDSNPLQINLPKNNINEDQCVPIVDHQLDNKGNELPEFTLSASFSKGQNKSVASKDVNTNDTCEPMDVDETLPECGSNVSAKGSENQEKLLLNNTQEININMNQTSNRSKRKSSISLSTSQNLEKSNNENKSTLVLSQLKDLSNSENKSPKISKRDQLSQSSNLLNITQENEKRKKITLNYLTSTPLQQKTNLGDNGKNKSNNIFDNNVSKNKDNVTPKRNVSEISGSEQISEAGSESEADLETSKTSNLLDNEADEASDNYESGDSQDEDEKQYEKDNEIVEKGETLTSEDEQSDDSDYEKDSFVVTSDEEDNELLSGSGDDLTMSDNELKMNPKSKKKYNAKKLKEQKQASREMYESRHKLNTSKKNHNSSTSKNGEKSRQRLDSSNSENSDDIIKFTKKNRRMRLDSTTTDSINISRIENTDSRKKDMDMSGSSDNENILKEKEITINEGTTENIGDPLALHIKEENVSVKEQNISINFVDTDVQKDNTSNSKSLESKNPLGCSDNETSSSLSTEDENITQNYNDMLNDLNNKTANHSLNIEKKSKKKSSIPIVDHLNITQTKALNSRNMSSKKDNTTIDQDKKITENWFVTNYLNQEADQHSSENNDTTSISNNKNLKYGDCSLNLENKPQKKGKTSILDQLNLTQGSKKSKKNDGEKRKSKTLNINKNLNNDDSSDSIDLKLLFSEDSINSSDLSKSSVKKAANDTDNFIPLKKAEAKTDIRVTTDLVDDDNAEPPFFVDTIGNQPSNSSGNEKIVNKKDTHMETQGEEEGSCDDDSSEEPLEISYKKEQNEKFVKKNKNANVDIDETDQRSTPIVDKSLLAPQNEKKRKKSVSTNLSQTEDISDKSLIKDIKKKNTSFNVSNLNVLFSVESIIECDNNKFINKTPGSEKKKMKKLSEPNECDAELNNTEIALNKSTSKTPKSEKKKKNLSISENSETFDLVDKISDETSNNQNSLNESIAKTPASAKKKAKTLLHLNVSDIELNNTEVALNKSITKTPKSEKKEKKLSMSENSETFNLVIKTSDESLNKQNPVNESIAKTPNSGKKKMKKLSKLNDSEVELNIEGSLNNSKSKKLLGSENKPNSETNKKKLFSLNQDESEIEVNQTKKDNADGTLASDGDITKSKKRKRSSSKHLLDAASEGNLSKTSVVENDMVVCNKKKRKLSHKSQENDTQEPETNSEITLTQNTKNETINPVVQPNMSQKTVTKKRSKQSYDPTCKDLENTSDANTSNAKEVISERTQKDDNVSGILKPKSDKNKKRKNRDDDNDTNEALKIRKENAFDHIHISWLPPSILNNLDDKPNKVKLASKKQKIISTTDFEVEETNKRRIKPSNYLEESIYLNDDESMEEHKRKSIIKKPKVLPFVPTAITSNSGYTTNFKVNVMPQEIKFVAQSNNVNNFKNEYLYGKKIKRLGTYDLYKKCRNIKMSKF